jgi:hypothetical protein
MDLAKDRQGHGVSNHLQKLTHLLMPLEVLQNSMIAVSSEAEVATLTGSSYIRGYSCVRESLTRKLYETLETSSLSP